MRGLARPVTDQQIRRRLRTVSSPCPKGPPRPARKKVRVPPYRADEEAVKENAEAEEGWDEADACGDEGAVPWGARTRAWMQS